MRRQVPRARMCMAMPQHSNPKLTMSNLSETLPVIDLDIFLSEHDSAERVQQECVKVSTCSASKLSMPHSFLGCQCPDNVRGSPRP